MSATDVVYAVTALLESDGPSQEPVPWEANFWDAYDALSRFTTHHLHLLISTFLSASPSFSHFRYMLISFVLQSQYRTLAQGNLSGCGTSPSYRAARGEYDGEEGHSTGRPLPLQHCPRDP
jgi:hypothetical protein